MLHYCYFIYFVIVMLGVVSEVKFIMEITIKYVFPF
jgi:hypothetical protein